MLFIPTMSHLYYIAPSFAVTVLFLSLLSTCSNFFVFLLFFFHFLSVNILCTVISCSVLSSENCYYCSIFLNIHVDMTEGNELENLSILNDLCVCVCERVSEREANSTDLRD